MSEEKPQAHGRGEEDVPKVDVSERGAKLPDGSPQVMDRRLFVKLLVFDCPPGPSSKGAIDLLSREFERSGVSSVIYEDVNAPSGVGVVTFAEDPAHFVTAVRPAIAAAGPLTQRSTFSMLGRTYSQGYEQDLAFWLIDRPKSVMMNPEWKWAVW